MRARIGALLTKLLVHGGIAGLLAALSADPDKLAKLEEGIHAAVPLVRARIEGRATEEQLAAHLIGVDPFDQPAVEEGKVLAKKYLAGG